MNNKPRITRSSNVKNVIALEKSKQCIVRLEDIKKQQQKSATPQQQKAKPRILMKTPLQRILPKTPQTAPARQQNQAQNAVRKKQQHSEDDLDSNIDTSAFGRSRRTPKPNVKYFNDSVVTLKPGKRLKIDDDDEEADIISSDADFEEKDDNASDFDISEEEDVPPAKKTRLSATVATHRQQPQSTPAVQPQRRGVIAPVQKMMVKKPTIVEKTPVSAAPAKKTSIITYTTSNRNTVSRKRPLENSAPQKPATNVQKQVNNNNVQAIKPKPSVVANNKSYQVVRRSTAAAVPATSSSSSTPQIKKEVKKVTPQSKPVPAKKKPEPAPSKKDDTNGDNLEEDIENPMALNTIDDFEAMPTFTIVNINDIINKKGDVLMQQTFPKSEPEDKKPEPEKQTNVTNTNVTKNRRKATHTVLKEEPSTKSPPPKTPFPPVAPKKVTSTAPGGPLKQIVMNKKVITSPPNANKKMSVTPSQIHKPPVRILNSTLCRQQPPVSPIINAQKQQQAPVTAPAPVPAPQPQPPKKEHQIKKSLSPQVQNNKRLIAPTSIQKRKLPEEKITVQKQGSRTIKKMTCFENWYVVHCAANPTPQKPAPNQLTLPLIKIANGLQDICLPSEKWTSKVALSLIPESVYQRGQFERYTGHYHDKSIVKDDIKHRYQPASILFRRSQKPNVIDRTVILKNRTFLIYIQGKSVHLVGSPKIVKDVEDIESLLDCVDHLELNSEDVDVSPSIPNSA